MADMINEEGPDDGICCDGMRHWIAQGIVRKPEFQWSREDDGLEPRTPEFYLQIVPGKKIRGVKVVNIFITVCFVCGQQITAPLPKPKKTTKKVTR